ncbi:30S ribosomal protein S4 [Candidatus Bathyarchaeota archaeon]|nr:MAG: 30S ribosomal protein S4 [Candidatus Bathyarchaeota archaeon]
MGDPKKKHKRYTTPKRPYDQDALMEELRLIGAYGLRNKRELWRHRTELSRIRRMAREKLSMDPVERAEGEREMIRKLHSLGLVGEKATLEDILSLRIEDLMERRLQTIVFRKGMAKSLFQARQLITHGHISIGGRKVRAPSYHVTLEDEAQLEFAGSSPLAVRDHPLRRELTVSEMTGGEMNE